MASRGSVAPVGAVSTVRAGALPSDEVVRRIAHAAHHQGYRLGLDCHDQPMVPTRGGRYICTWCWETREVPPCPFPDLHE